jgi:hypothetical protein
MRSSWLCLALLGIVALTDCRASISPPIVPAALRRLTGKVIFPSRPVLTCADTPEESIPGLPEGLEEDDDPEEGPSAKRGTETLGELIPGPQSSLARLGAGPHQRDGTFLAAFPPLIYTFCSLLI